MTTHDDLTIALRAALGAAGPTWQQQPSVLRRRLEEALGHSASHNRGAIHQLVVAAEEKVPSRLARFGGGAPERSEVAETLAATRGWSPWAAEWAVGTWASALGLTTDPPPIRQTRATAPGVPSTEVPAGAVAPTELPADLIAPTELPGLPLPGTVLPGTVLPGTVLPEDDER